MKRWLADLHHDLLKHALFYAQDLQALGEATAADQKRLLACVLNAPDSEGQPQPIDVLWQDFYQAAVAKGAQEEPLLAFAERIDATALAARKLAAGGGSLTTLLAALFDLARAYDVLCQALLETEPT